MKREKTRTITENGFAVTFHWKEDKVSRVEVKRFAGKGRRAATLSEARWVTMFLAGESPRVPLDASALTPFQKKVFDVVSAIPVGRTLTYGEVARRVGKPGAARAVGQALRANPYALFIPCHRVVSEGGLGGYGGKRHSEVKRALLLMERSRPSATLR